MCNLELKRYFGFDKALTPKTADEAWEKCNSVLADPDMNVHAMLRREKVDVIATTDDPADDLRWHKMISEDKSLKTRVLPAMRPDKAVNINKAEFPAYIRTLGEAAGTEINSFEALKKALILRMDYFAAMGCRVTDHGLDYIPYVEAEPSEVEEIFTSAMNGNIPDETGTDKFKTAMLVFLGEEYAQRGWVMQLHYGAIRNANTKMFREKGPDTGYDCISDRSSTEALVRLLDSLAVKDALPKTILYSLNPNDNAMLTTVMGCFQGYGDANHVQHGAAWWFNDTKEGMERQISNLAAESVLGNFVGMLTDSRSFFSYARHDYFRRILCNVIGTWVEKGSILTIWKLWVRLCRISATTMRRNTLAFKESV